MKVQTLRYPNPLSAILEDFFSIRFKPYQVVCTIIFQIPSRDQPRELRMEVLKEAAQLGVNLYEIHQRFVNSFEPQWRSDENIMLLLSAIALFTPERSNVVHKDVVKFEQVKNDLFVFINDLQCAEPKRGKFFEGSFCLFDTFLSKFFFMSKSPYSTKRF